MNTITGIGKKCMMKHRRFIFICCIFFAACGDKQQPSNEIKPRALVTITNIKNGTIEHTEKIGASTIYLQRSQVTAPVAGYISSVQLKSGDKVHKGQLLYSIETKERRALGQWQESADSVSSNYGIIKVYAAIDGIITTIDKQQSGEFVTEGSVLCSIASPGSLYFQLNIPYEYEKFIAQNPVCTITMPDGKQIKAMLVKPLAQATSGLQSISYLAKPENFSAFLPENLTATASLVTYKKNNAQLLSKQAVLSDELMGHFWVMQLQNDSTAIKIPVVTGEKNDSLIEIVKPILLPGDRILLTGNYGLSDTATVKIQ
jgi:multidrug efflux pump subunit AcrA (membrane-fusion protein)